MTVSNLNKFKLLIWKNWRLQWNHKLGLLFELLLPVFFCLLIIVIRNMRTPTRIKDPTTYRRLENNLQQLWNKVDPNSASPIQIRNLAYSPKNEILENFMNKVSDKLKLSVLPIGFENGKQLEEYMKQLDTQAIAAIQFDDNLSNMNKLPDGIVYTIRFPSELRTYDLEEFWYTDRLHDEFELITPRNKYEDGGDPGYLREGFIPIQHEIAMEFISELAELNNKEFNVPPIYIQRTPYPPYYEDILSKSIQDYVPLIIVLSLNHQAAQTVKRITNEKEKQLKEVMQIMGIPNWLHWVSWFVMTFLFMQISVTSIIILLYIPLAQVAIFQYSNIILILIVFLIYCVTIITFCFMLSSIFRKASTATGVTCLVWFIFYVPYQTTIANYKDLGYGSKILLLLFFNTAMAYALTLILRFELKGEGLQWNNLFQPVNVDDNLSISTILLIMLLTAVIHMLLALYFEKVFTGNYAVPEKWYFPISKEYWYGNKDNTITNENVSLHKENRRSGIQNISTYKKIGVSIRQLTKVYNKQRVVNNLNLNLYENEITVLLGHNGAGKTTTMSMLTGMIPATSGTAIINGYDINTNLKGARSSLGLCPQYNILFDELTVREHIIFYSKLKGLNENEVEHEITKYLNILRMQTKIHTEARNLSGGMQRKLSVVAALFGGTKVVFLDEPSSGMDPAARRTLWDLLKLEKKGRTIVLSTHFMDEADVLGDRIAILSAGKLQCYGTSFFLKKKYGTGYHLICVKLEDCNPDLVTNLLKKYIPNIEIDKDVGSELSYQLSDSNSKKFPHMFKDLEDNSKTLKLEGYGVSITTLDEVFMLLGAEKHQQNDGLANKLRDICKDMKAGTTSSGKFIYSQWKAMILKKYLYTKRNYYIILAQLLLVLFAVVATGIVLMKKNSDDWPPLLISVKDYPKISPILSFTDNELAIVKSYDKYMKSFGSEYTTTATNISFEKYYLKIEPYFYITKYLFGAEFSNEFILVYFNNELYHILPLSFNVLHNALLRSILPDDKYKIQVINYPLPRLPSTRMKSSKTSFTGGGYTLAVNSNFTMSFVTSFFVIFLIKERESRARLLQFVSGVKISIFWLSHLIYDFIVFTLVTFLGILVFSLFQVNGYKTFGELLMLYFIMLVYGLVTISFVYAISVFYEEAVTAFSYISIINTLTGAIFIAVYVFTYYDMKGTADIFSFLFGIFPNFILSDSINNLYIKSLTESACLDMCTFVPAISPCNLHNLCHFNETCCVPGYFSMEKPGNGKNFLFIILLFILSVLSILLSSYQKTDIFVNIIRQKKSPPMRTRSQIIRDHNMDDDVKKEYLRIDNMTIEERESTHLVLDKVTKYYKNFLAVKQVSVGVTQSVCFGLLGVNGAGKTTLFKMMTGDLKMTYGNGYINGKSLATQMHEIYHNIGYCPQFDALLEDLTGREILHIFCLLRGIPENKINEIADFFAHGFGYKKHIDKPAGTYSGGNKRKLSTTIAMLGCPSVIYLDEPTSGMDPGARRQLWNMVDQMRSTGKVIVLTSHSMEECEALCTRLAIMVNGEFKCIGSTQHLKNKFAKGLVLKIKVKRSNAADDDNEDDNIIRLTEFISIIFPDSILREQYQEMLTYNIPLSSVKWSEIFYIIESSKAELQIEDYTISQTTLEEIFLGFALSQKEEKRLSVPTTFK